MIRLAGGAILVVSAVIWGRRQGESVKKRCAITAALCDFVRYTGERIETFREPLCDIFSSYKDHTEVPDVSGKSADFARQMLTAAGLNCQVAGDSAGTVQSQSEAAGSSVQKGTVVTITCG